jgi:hypothetical protein
MSDEAITIDGDVEAVTGLDRQIEFAGVSTATSLAIQSQAAAIQAIETTFQTTNPWYLPGNRFGVHYTPATPERPTAQVKTNAYWLIDHETGGLRTASEGQYLAVPTETIQPNKREPIPPNQRPASLENAFILKTARGLKLFERINNQLRVVYNLVKGVRIPKHSTIVDPTIRTVQKNAAQTYYTKLLEAIRTAK